MNFYDWVLIALFAIGALWGFRKGLIDAVLLVISIYVALLLSGLFAGRLLSLIWDDAENQALATAIGYVIIFVGVFFASSIVSRIIKASLKAVYAGWIDKVGGVLVGIVAGVMLGVGLVIGGWWVLLMFSRHGFEFLHNWFVGGSAVPDVTGSEGGLGRQLLRDLSQMGGALTGLMVLGIFEGLRLLRDPAEKPQRNALAFLLAWAGCAASRATRSRRTPATCWARHRRLSIGE